MSLRDDIISALVSAQISSPRLEADIILKHSAPDYPVISSIQEENARNMLSRRLKKEPLDKIIGVREFYKYNFKVNSNVLSPRPDTEILLESALQLIPKDIHTNILDLGTGSGCILLSLLKECPNSTGVGVDISSEALEISIQNAKLLDVYNRVKFINKSWNDIDFEEGKFDIIVSNPPYIPTSDIAGLEPEVRDYDPITALDGGIDGYNCYREIAKFAHLTLKKGGYILLEAGIGQDNDIVEIFIPKGLTHVQTISDLSGINRCVILKK